MKILLHFLISNIKYNKVELAISYGVTIIFTLLYNYFSKESQVLMKDLNAAELFISVAFYAVLYVFFSQKRKTSVKYFLSIPLSKAQVLFYKSTADIIFFVPSIYFIMLGTYFLNLENNFILLLISLILLSIIAALWMFDHEIEQPRLDNAKSSFINRLVYLRKSTEFVFRSILIGYLFVFVFVLPLDFIWKEYLFLIFLCVTLFMKFHKSLLLLKDESLSYFQSRRDLLRIGWKLALLIGPLIFMQLKKVGVINPYGNEQIFSYIYHEDIDSLHNYYHKHRNWDVKGKNNFTPLLTAIHLGKTEIASLILESGAKLNLKEKFKNGDYIGFGPIDLAIESQVPEMIDFVFKNGQNLDQNLKDDSLLYASKKCQPEIINEILKNGPNINKKDKKGKTSLHYQASNKCYSGIIMLVEAGIDVDILDNDNKAAIDYVEGNNIAYFLNKNMKKKVVIKKNKEDNYNLERDLASKLILK